MIFLIMIIAIIGFDQYTKYMALKNLKPGISRYVLKNKIQLTLHKNKGVALNFLEKYPKLIKTIVIAIISVLTLFMIKIINKKNFTFMKIGLGFILGGGIGNFIDRIKKGYVVDFFTFKFKKCPIFNFADIFIILGTIILQIFYLLKNFSRNL